MVSARSGMIRRSVLDPCMNRNRDSYLLARLVIRDFITVGALSMRCHNLVCDMKPTILAHPAQLLPLETSIQ
jgi:hypothetical protein